MNRDFWGIFVLFGLAAAGLILAILPDGWWITRAIDSLMGGEDDKVEDRAKKKAEPAKK